MRTVSFILAIIAAAALYFWVIERENTVAYIDKIRSDPAYITTTPAPNNATGSTLKDDAEIIGVVALRSIAREIDSAVILRGQTQAFRQVNVRSETSSTVLSPPLRKGTFVEKDQILCQLAAGARSSAVSEAHARLAEAKARKVEAESRIPEKQARVAEAKARLEEALVKLKIATSLSEGGFASDPRLKNAQAVNAAAQAALEAARSGVIGAKSGIESAAASIESAAAAITAAEIEFERLVIDAPFAGLLESDTAELGSLLQQGSLCATIIQLNPIKLIAYAPETEVNRIAIGAPAKAELAAGGGTVNGVVTFLSRSSDPETRTFLVEIEVPNSNLEIRDGQTAEIIISAAGAQAHLLPSSALTLNQEGQIGLRTLSASNKVSFIPVTVMRDTTQGVWLTGLPDEVNVIVVGQEFVTAGVTVIPTYTEQTK